MSSVDALTHVLEVTDVFLDTKSEIKVEPELIKEQADLIKQEAEEEPPLVTFDTFSIKQLLKSKQGLAAAGRVSKNNFPLNDWICI